ncbi:hypothetical protein D3C83_176900 [compost metagenome]
MRESRRSGIATNPSPFENPDAAPQTSAAEAYAVFVSVVARHRAPTFPVTVNVRLVPGRKVSPEPDQT